MKNIFLTLALLLTVSFAFATNGVENVSTVDIVTAELTNSVELASANFTMENNALYAVSLEAEVASCGFPVSWDVSGSTGSFWMDCDDDTTMGDILDLIFLMFF